jgi:hypothetical protein
MASGEEYHQVGKKLKANGHPIGQSLAHAYGDAPGFCYQLLWAFGGKEVETDGKKKNWVRMLPNEISRLQFNGYWISEAIS